MKAGSREENSEWDFMLEYFVGLLLYFQRQYGLLPNTLYIDGELYCGPVIPFAEEHGIELSVNTPDQSHENGVVERRNRTLAGLVRSNLNYAKLPINFWPLSVINSMTQ